MALSRSEFVPYAPKDRGGQIHIHHCKQGHNNDRLYIRRNEDESIVAYCHHCGKSGYSFPDNTQIRKAKDVHIHTWRHGKPSSESSSTSGQENLRKTWDKKDSSYSRHRATYEEQPFLIKSRINQELIDKYEIKVIGDRIYFPIFDSAGENLKVVLGRGENPKWLAEWLSADKTYTPIGSGDTCVVVEDVVSAIRIAECGYSALPCLSSSLRDSLLPNLENYGTIVVWLDNDNSQVLYNTLKIKNKINLINDNVWICRGKQPKDMSDMDIIKYIGGIEKHGNKE